MSGKINSETGDFIEGGSDDAGYHDLSEHLGAKHRKRFGYTTTGAEVNDNVLLAKGGSPLHFDKRRQQNSGESRTGHFNAGVVGGIVG